jgi:hypothetical protein
MCQLILLPVKEVESRTHAYTQTHTLMHTLKILLTHVCLYIITCVHAHTCVHIPRHTLNTPIHICTLTDSSLAIWAWQVANLFASNSSFVKWDQWWCCFVRLWVLNRLRDVKLVDQGRAHCVQIQWAINGLGLLTTNSLHWFEIWYGNISKETFIKLQGPSVLVATT